jgi:hypothetical protein
MILSDLLSGIAIVTSMIMLGLLLMRLTAPGIKGVYRLGFSYPIGAALFSWGIFMMSWAGVPLTRVTVSILVLVFAGGLLAIHKKLSSGGLGSEDQPNNIKHPHTWKRLQTGFLAATTLGLILALLIAIGRSHGRWDAAAGWVVKGYGIFLEGDVRAGASWGAWDLAYPLNIHLQNGLFRLFGGDYLPASKVIPTLYLGSALSTILWFWQAQGVNRLLASLGILVLISNPLLVLHGTIGYANLPLGTYLISSVVLAIRGLSKDDKSLVVVSGLFAGGVVWTRPEGIMYVLVFALALTIGALFLRQGKQLPRRALYWLIPPVLVALTWFSFSWSNVEASHLGKAMGGVIPSLLRGEFRLWELYLIPRLLLERALTPEIWGGIFPAIAILGILGIRRLVRMRQEPSITWLFIASVAISLVPVCLFYIRSFTRNVDFIQLLNRSFDRAFIPAILILFTFVVSLSSDPPPPNLKSPVGTIDAEDLYNSRAP